MSGDEFIDRYQALDIPYPDPDTACEGDCEALGVVPIKRGESDPRYAALWAAAEAKEPTEDGWHFVVCSNCNGSGKRVPL